MYLPTEIYVDVADHQYKPLSIHGPTNLHKMRPPSPPFQEVSQEQRGLTQARPLLASWDTVGDTQSMPNLLQPAVSQYTKPKLLRVTARAHISPVSHKGKRGTPQAVLEYVI